jgi:TPR repeat protein
LFVAAFGFSLGLTAAHALDGTKSPANIAPAIGRDVPQEEILYSGHLREWLHARQIGDIEAARKFLEDAARDGDVGAAWELGRMYADGDGVKPNHQLAFEYFAGIADSHADEPTGTARARFVASAFVRLGSYYLRGIPNSNIKPNAVRGRDMFSYAASYFGDPDAQYHLGRMYLDGQGGGKDTKQGIRWLSLAADKGQYQAQAVLGALLFKGQSIPRDGTRGLAWLMVAQKAATAEETWITDQYTAAMQQATAEEQTRALDRVKHWNEQSRGGRRE